MQLGMNALDYAREVASKEAVDLIRNRQVKSEQQYVSSGVTITQLNCKDKVDAQPIEECSENTDQIENNDASIAASDANNDGCDEDDDGDLEYFM